MLEHKSANILWGIFGPVNILARCSPVPLIPLHKEFRLKGLMVFQRSPFNLLFCHLPLFLPHFPR